MAVKANNTILERKKRKIAALAHIATSMEFVAFLPHNNVANADNLSAIAFYSTVLGIGIAAVAR